MSEAWKHYANELTACQRHLAEAQAQAAFWVIERFENQKSAGYWTGANSRDFTFDIEKALQFRRKQDAFWVTRGWHWTDVKITEHMYMPLSPTAKLTGSQLILRERARQMVEEGWTPEHDDEHKAGVRQLVIAGALIAAEIDRLQRSE